MRKEESTNSSIPTITKNNKISLITRQVITRPMMWVVQFKPEEYTVYIENYNLNIGIFWPLFWLLYYLFCCCLFTRRRHKQTSVEEKDHNLITNFKRTLKKVINNTH